MSSVKKVLLEIFLINAEQSAHKNNYWKYTHGESFLEKSEGNHREKENICIHRYIKIHFHLKTDRVHKIKKERNFWKIPIWMQF